MIELAGAISHIDTFDFKEDEGTPKDLDVRQVRNDLYLSHRLFPEMSKEMDKVAIVRSMKSHEVVHFRGQYYTQAGRPLNPAQAPEIPSVGSVVAYELESQRREHDTFPTYIGCNLDTSGCGALSTGFLHPRHSVLDINLAQAVVRQALEGDALALLEERYRLLQRTRQGGVGRLVRAATGASIGFRHFRTAPIAFWAITRWPEAFQMTHEERARYGDNEVGLGCLLARNLVDADAGTRYIHITHPDWDHHKKDLRSQVEIEPLHSLQRVRQGAVRTCCGSRSSTKSPRDPGKTLLDETMVVMVTEFVNALLGALLFLVLFGILPPGSD